MAKVTLIGHVGNDIIVQSGTSGRDYVRFSLACRDGPDRTNWFRVVNFNPKATAFMLASVKKGSLVCVDGSIRLIPYTTDDGKRHNSICVLQNSIHLLKEPQNEDKEESK